MGRGRPLIKALAGLLARLSRLRNRFACSCDCRGCNQTGRGRTRSSPLQGEGWGEGDALSFAPSPSPSCASRLHRLTPLSWPEARDSGQPRRGEGSGRLLSSLPRNPFPQRLPQHLFRPSPDHHPHMPQRQIDAQIRRRRRGCRDDRVVGRGNGKRRTAERSGIDARPADMPVAASGEIVAISNIRSDRARRPGSAAHLHWPSLPA